MRAKSTQVYEMGWEFVDNALRQMPNEIIIIKNAQLPALSSRHLLESQWYASISVNFQAAQFCFIFFIFPALLSRAITRPWEKELYN